MRPFAIQSILLLGVGLLVAGGAAPALGQERNDQRKPKRAGFTLELDIGGGYTHASPAEGDNSGGGGMTGLPLSIGAFLTRDWAIMYRASSTSYYEDVAGESKQFFNSIDAVAVQNWLNDRLFWSLGIGIARWGELAFPWEDEDVESKTGFGGLIRAGYSFANWEHHSLRFSLEVTPARYEDLTVIGTGLNFGWQYF